MTTAAPQIPPRPSRSEQQQPATGSMEVPQIPPRPSQRRIERSESPHRDSYPRSPLNETSFGTSYSNISGNLYSSSQNVSSSSLGLPHRPPSVALPSIGQEGNEYGTLEYEEETSTPADQGTDHSSITQTRNVSNDLPLHAPKPSFSTSDAKQRVATVTRTDSSQAAAAGIGKAGTPVQHGDDRDPHNRALNPKISFTRTGSSASTERPPSSQLEGEIGIPEIGQRVPMYPNAGDVQAPSPSPFSQTQPVGIGFHTDGSHKSYRHHRTRSGREVFHGPPGSYGLHGHGTPNQDRFEKAWYEKHPDALLREEHGQYGPGIGGGRGEWALSSEDLNKIVRETASRGVGFGTSPDIVGRPDEQIGYMASEEYASRLNSPRPHSAGHHPKSQSNQSQPSVESPLRKASFPVDVHAKEDFEKSKDYNIAQRRASDNVLESDTEDDDVIHVDPPAVHLSKYDGNGYDPPTEDLGPHGGNTEAEGGWIEERGYGVPILASDEVAKEPASEFMQPAVPPVQERRGSTYYAGVDSDAPPFYQSGHRNGSHSGSVSGSRSSSRPGSMYGTIPNLARFTSHDDREDMHTPLEDVEEYEPLFPDEQDEDGRPLTAADRFKRRPDMKRRFPSQDIWEDTPNSLQLQATVSTPEPTEEQSSPVAKDPSTVFEPPQAEAARKGEVDEEEKAKLIPKEERWAKSHFKPHIRDDMKRPGMKQRFPSRDIWEDTPDSAQLETTVGGPQGDDPMSTADEGMKAGAVVHTSGRPDAGKIMGEQQREGTTSGAAAIEKPSLPPRPAKVKGPDEAQETANQAPPSVPARPPRRLQQVPLAEIPVPPGQASAETSPTSPIDTRKAPVLPDRPKPQVPPRPSRPVAHDLDENIPLSKTTSVTSVGSAGSDTSATKGIASPPATKPKPMLPSRPVGGKIAALKAGFLNDLDKRLQLGPQGVKPQEKPMEYEEKEEMEKAPLSDARKGRARGPARRKPAAPSDEVGGENMTSSMAGGPSKFEIAAPWTVWQISEDGHVDVVHAARSTPKHLEGKAEEASTPTLATNTAGDAVHAPDENNSRLEGGVYPATDAVKGADRTAGIEFSQGESATAIEAPGSLPQDDTDAMSSTAAAVAEDDSRRVNPWAAELSTAHAAAQTGEKHITTTSAEGVRERITAFIGGRAPEEGDVVFRGTDGEEEHTDAGVQV
ncbi:Protein of unknown function DUF3210 [Lasallia pustulata]|uniref:Altered inheritance of mitochondria protein 21 n=1 Tax=Lasallia pustulata TaxID=136370 RepID=A0A1W5CVG6_9LECA|nr:Protein of unknown function DUF3210 [Lasallia pustulata]